MNGSERPDLIARFDAGLLAHERELIETACAWVEAHDTHLYLVGGSVRDLVLGRDRLDLDLAIEGDALALARVLAARFAARLTAHEQFGTAALEGMGWTLDLVRTRAERYTAPAALPEVGPGSIDDDLARRDFTVHAMALRLYQPGRGVLLDPFGGERDLINRVYRVLHEDSFRDDPTRILRLARYVARLGFGVEPRTLAFAWRDAGYIDLLSPARIAHELERGFAERLPELMLATLDELHAVPRVFGEALPVAALPARFDRLRDDGGPRPAMAEYVCTIAAGWPRVALERLSRRIELRQDAITALHDLPSARRALRELVEERAPPGRVVEALGRCALAAVRGAAAAAGGSNARLVRRYLREWRELRPRLRGDDLIALGAPRGPRIGELLRALTAARLDGALPNRAAEEA
ncbi:MAG TPA: hypothetical protein VFD32_23360, partial [Dehalococcoidia bacterium]|nr:hypothetical protein [Dehalococcoidia bacterium]